MKPVKNQSRTSWSKCLLQTLALGTIVLLAAAPARAVTFTWTTNAYLSGTTNFMTLATGWSKLASFSIGGGQVTFGGETWSAGGGNNNMTASGPNGFSFNFSRPNHYWGSSYNGYDPVSNNVVNKQGSYANPDTGPYCRLQITGFIPGQEYQIQFIVADSRSAQYGRTVTIEPVSSDGNTLLGGNSTAVQYSYNNGNNDAHFAVVTADFVADASSYNFVPWCLDSSSSPTGPQINAIRITTPPAAPILVTWDNGSGSGAWNTTDTNWTGYAWNNSLPNTALISSLPGTTNINLSQNITARDVTWGNLTGSLTNAHTLTVTNSFNVQGNGGNYFPYTNNPTFTLDGPTLNVAGDLGIGRMNLLVGNSTINAKLITSAAVNGAVGDLIISPGAIVRATNGIDYNVNDQSASSSLELNGGTLYVPSINACDDTTDYAGRGIMKWNGGTLVPTADNANFITVYNANSKSAVSDTFVENGGAVIDTAGHSIGIGVNLLADEGAGGLTKNGNGTLTLSGANNDYTGPTVLNAGSLVLSSGATLPNSSAISVGSGTTFDISAASFVLGTNQVLSGSGTVTGSIAASSGPGSGLNAATAGTAGTLTISGNVDLSVGATIGFDLSPSASSGNDQIVVGGNLTLSSSDTIHIKGLSGTANLDSSADYVLFSVSGTTTVGSQPALVWDVPKPANYGHYVIATSGNNVVLHYLTGTPPTITSATITPSTLTRNQSAFVSVTVANGTGSVDPNTGVVLAAAQGQVPLVLSATPNVYTNTIVIPASANVGLETNTVTATDSLALSGISTVVVTVVAANQVWNGAGPDINTDDNMNWVSGMAPGYVGDSVTFAGSTQPTPNLDANYSFTGIAFDSTATNFNLSTLNSSVLTLTAPASIANASTNDQTISLPIAGTNGLTKTGNGTLTLSAASTYTGGTAINAGRLVALDNAQALGAGNVSIATNATLEVNYSGSLKIAGTTLTGTGTLQKTGAGTLTLGQSGINGGTVNISLSGGALIDLQAGTLESSSAYQGNWDNNKASLNVAGGAIFQVKETQVNVDALTGSGTVEQDYGGNGIYVGVNNGSGTFSGVIQDGAVSLALTKSGSGTQTLSGANTYTGSTTVSNGTLLVNGSLAAGSAVTVASGALGGVGSIGGATTVNAGGYLAPGTNGVGTLTFANNLTLNAASTNNFVVTANGASNNVAVTGTLTPNGSVIHIAAGTALGLGTNTLFTCGTISGAFSAAPVFDVAQNNVGSIVNDGAGHINLVMVTGVNTDPATANFAASVTGSAGSKTLNFTWAPDHKGWQLYTNAVGLTATGSWFPVPGSASVTNESITVDSTKPNVFFQLRYP